MRLPRPTRLAHAALGAAGVVALLVLEPEPAALVGAPSVGARALVLSDQARRHLRLQYRSYRTEFLACMIGEIRGHTVIVRRIAPADVDPARSTPTHVLPRHTCEEAGWSGTVGVIHSHPGGERCYYYFPGTGVATADAESFARQPYPVDAIMCGDGIVWINRDMVQRRLPLEQLPTTSRPTTRRENAPLALQ
ncbi:MAG TPA: Mov34/MPN/PAD-1 family protein [Gemmatimonadales bacterium]|nr:Mov34/MPN/PAD-1 family protein [Gemmatimonadales bacterium]